MQYTTPQAKAETTVMYAVAQQALAAYNAHTAGETLARYPQRLFQAFIATCNAHHTTPDLLAKTLTRTPTSIMCAEVYRAVVQPS